MFLIGCTMARWLLVARDRAQLHYHLGLTHQKLQDPTRAKIELEKAISINPKSDLTQRVRQAISENPVS